MPGAVEILTDLAWRQARVTHNTLCQDIHQVLVSAIRLLIVQRACHLSIEGLTAALTRALSAMVTTARRRRSRRCARASHGTRSHGRR